MVEILLDDAPELKSVWNYLNRCRQAIGDGIYFKFFDTRTKILYERNERISK